MSNPLKSVALDGIAIRQDDRGRFCLNDLHQAAGGEARHRPNYWLELEQTRRLIDACAKSLILSDTGNPATEKNNHLEPVATLRGFGPQGTYVIRELVYAYAMWISAEFHLRAIRFLDHALTGDPHTEAQAAWLLQRTRDALLETVPELDLVLRCTQARLTNAQTARAVGVSQRSIERFKAQLRRLGLLPEVAPVCRPGRSEAQMALRFLEEDHA